MFVYNNIMTKIIDEITEYPEIDYKKYKNVIEQICTTVIYSFKHGLRLLNKKDYIIPAFDNSHYSESLILWNAACLAKLFYDKASQIGKEKNIPLEDLDLEIGLTSVNLIKIAKSINSSNVLLNLAIKTLENARMIKIVKRDNRNIYLINVRGLHQLKIDGYNYCSRYLESDLTVAIVNKTKKEIFDYIEYYKDTMDPLTLFR